MRWRPRPGSPWFRSARLWAWPAAMTLMSLSTTTWAAPTAPIQSDVARFALVVGNNRPEPGSEVQALRYADDDALGVGELLRQARVATVLLARPDTDSRRMHPRRTVQGPPTLAALWQAWDRLTRQIRKASDQHRRTELMFFFSGHGDVAHGEGYLVFEDGRLTRRLLYQRLLERSPAAVNHVIIDACKAYFVAAGKGLGGTRQAYHGPAFSDIFDPTQVPLTGFVLSSSSARDSHEWEEYQAGVFTHQIRSALRGAADADGDRHISYAEIGAFLGRANRAIANPRFRPEFLVVPPGAAPQALSRTILGWPPDGRALTIQPANLGHVYVESARGERLLDAHPHHDQPLLLHLPSLRPLFVRSADGRREAVIDDHSLTAIAPLQDRPVVVSRKGALHIALRLLFAQPFGHADVQAFHRSYQQDYLAARTRADTDAGVSRRTPRHTARTVAGWTAIGAAAVGIGLQAWALGWWLADRDAPQNERPAVNDGIQTLNIAAIASYSVAAVAGATWLTLFLLRDHENGHQPAAKGSHVAVAPLIGSDGARLTVRLAF